MSTSKPKTHGRTAKQDCDDTEIADCFTILHIVYRLGNAGACKGCARHAARYPAIYADGPSPRSRGPICFLADIPACSCLSSASMT